MIFREYDIRGIVDKQISISFARNLGKALGTYIKGSIAVGRDNRLSSEKLRNALVRGILSTGCNVVEMGHITTPILFFAVKRYKRKHSVKGGVIVSGSHNPGLYNGFKIVKGKKQVSGKGLQEVKEIMSEKKFKKGHGKLIVRNPLKSYAKFILGAFVFKRRLKVVVDCGNGMASLIVPGALHLLGCKVFSLNKIPSGHIPLRIIDPMNPKNLKSLMKSVKKNKADIGLAFDGDADRLGVVTERGTIIDADKLLLMIARDLLKKKKKAKVAYDVKCSDVLPWYIKRRKGRPLMCRTGRTFISKEMREEKADLGCELTGHFFFKELDYFDDAFYAACKLLEILSKTDKKLSEIEAKIPKLYNTPEIRIKCPDKKKIAVVEKLKELFKDEKLILVDGIKVYLDGGWGLVRASNSEDVLVMRFEAKTPVELRKIRRAIEKKVKLALKTK